MVNVTKSFYPVGQGGFYSERILYNGKPFTIVYDCGAVVKSPRSGPTKELIDCINNSGLGKVDVVVISHLDDDHINGLYLFETYLSKQNCKPLIFIPQTQPFDLLLFYCKSSSQSIKLFLETAHEEKRIVFISNENNDDKENIKDLILEDGSIKIDATLGGKTLSHDGLFSPSFQMMAKNPWRFKFYVKKRRFKKLKQKEESLIRSINSFQLFQKEKNRLKEIYRTVGRQMNGSSMSMLSFPKIDEPTSNSVGVKNAHVTWMNGDAILKGERNMDAIEKHFIVAKNFNIDYQMPHHGSVENFMRFPWNKSVKSYIWFGTKNSYGHPDSKVVNFAKNKSLKCTLISEKIKSPIVLHETWFIK